MSQDKDERITAPQTFAECAAIYGPFELDAAATHATAQCDRYYTTSGLYHSGTEIGGADGLSGPWAGRVWCNPPYSELPAWVAKAHEEAQRPAVESVTMLMPANRCEQPFWQLHIEAYRDGRESSGEVKLTTRLLKLTTRFLAKRRSFLHPLTGEMGSPMFGLVVVHWGQP